jgi:hypothetical protein
MMARTTNTSDDEMHLCVTASRELEAGMYLSFNFESTNYFILHIRVTGDRYGNDTMMGRSTTYD